MATLQEGIRLYRLRRWDLALQELLQVTTSLTDEKESSELTYYLGLCYTKLGRFDDALLHLEQVVTDGRVPMRVSQCRMTLAYIYTLTKRAEMAEFELTSLLKTGYESPTLYTTMAYAAWSQKNYKKAVELYRKALDLDENNTTALNGLGYLLVDTGSDLERGLKLCKKAVERKPQNAAYLDSLSWAYFKKGNASEAKVLIRKAIDLAPQQRDIRNHQKIIMGES
jgi:tetratricopeptide (TPR) repeat protein